MGQELTTNALSTLSQQLTKATDLLAPASEDGIAANILRLHRAGLAYPPGIDQQKAGQIYAFALKRIPIEALKRAVAKIVQGGIPDISRDFIPTPPRLAAICRAEALALYQDRDRLALTIESMRMNVPPPKSEEEKARVRAMVESVKADADRVRDENRIGALTDAQLDKLFRNKQFGVSDAPPADPLDEAFRKMHEEDDARDDR